MTVRVVLWRHGITAWNRAGRIQGRRDEPLSDEGRLELRARAVPRYLMEWPWVSSPLVRARETAGILSRRPVAEIPADDRLMEMDWGDWEGEPLCDLRARYGGEMAANEARGLYFRPPSGECPVEVQARALEWLADIAATGRDHAAVTHKGVIRVIMAKALDWDMTGRPPVRLRWTCPHRLAVEPGGAIRSAEFNLVDNEPERA